MPIRGWVLGWVLGSASLGLAQEPMRVSGGVMASQVLTREEPVYPAVAREAGVSGAVVLHALVGPDGLVKNLQVIAGPEMLRTAALEAVRQWTYRPYILNGVATAVDTTVTVRFGPGGFELPSVTAPPSVEMTRATDSSEAAEPHVPARIAGGVMAGMILSKVNPVYPPEAKVKGISGIVALRATISKNGAIENLAVIGGPEELRNSAVEAVSQWMYKPYLLNGEPTEVDTTITVNYTLGAGGAAASPAAAPATDGLGMFDGPPLPEGDAGAMGQAEPGVARISGGVMAGMIVKKVAPSYPAYAKDQHITGAVVMRAIIGKDGSISRLSVMSGPAELRKSAMDAVQKWRYKPFTLKGEPTEVDTTITVNYNMGW